jgi:hypothetical protein
MSEQEILRSIYEAVDDIGKDSTDENCTVCVVNLETVDSLMLIDCDGLAM